MAGNIQEYNAGDLGLRPSEVGVEARAGTARRIGMFSNQAASAEETLARETSRLAGETQQLGRQTEQLGSAKGAALTSIGRNVESSIDVAGEAAVKYLDHQQISQGSAAFAQLTQDVTNQWNQTAKNADPNNPSVAKDFLSGMEDRLQKFQDDGFYTEGGQKWAEAHVQALRQHMAEKTQADMSTLAGQAAVVNQQKTINSLSATVHSDPSSIDFALEALKSSTEGMLSTSPNLTGAQAGAARSEILQKGAESIVKSAAIGYIDKTAQIPPWATDPKYAPYINGPELQMLEKQAKAQQKSNELTDKQTIATNRQLADQKVHATSTKVMSDNVSIDPQSGHPVINPRFFKDALDIARNNPDAPSAAATVRTMFDWGEAQQNKTAKIAADDPATKQALTDRMFDPEHPTTRVDLMKAQVEGKLSNTSFTAMERLVTELEQSPLKGHIWNTTAAAVKEQLIRTDLAHGGDKVGSDGYAAFMQTFIPQYLAKSRAGTLEPNALNLQDPNSMISKAIGPYRASMQDRLKAGAKSINLTADDSKVTGIQTEDLPPITREAPRTAGNTYMTPQGKLKWTGTGWVKP